MKLGLKDDFTSNLAEALKDIEMQTIMDNRELIQTIAYYLVKKIEAGIICPDDICVKVSLALTLLTYRCIR